MDIANVAEDGFQDNPCLAVVRNLAAGGGEVVPGCAAIGGRSLRLRGTHVRSSAPTWA
jgi:hypothetical protein